MARPMAAADMSSGGSIAANMKAWVRVRVRARVRVRVRARVRVRVRVRVS